MDELALMFQALVSLLVDKGAFTVDELQSTMDSLSQEESPTGEVSADSSSGDQPQGQ